MQGEPMVSYTPNKRPQHIAIIMDGNGRWAHQRGMPRLFGHQEGATRVREVVEAACELKIETLTLYAFSQENWSRPVSEVSALFALLDDYLKSEVEEMHRQGIRISSIGDRHRLPKGCLKTLEHCERKTRANKGTRLVLALSYGARSDIVQSCQKIAKQVAAGELSWQEITQTTFANNLATWDLPDPDLLIRTSGEERVSNFLLWELAYSELYFTKVFWPDFTKAHFLAALDAYSNRERRFGALSVDGYEESQSNAESNLC